MKPLKVLGISASPRGGNSKALLEEAFSVLAELPVPTRHEIYSFQGKDMRHCIGCFSCVSKKGRCVHQDDFADLRDRWLDADVVVYSTPVYHMAVPSQFWVSVLSRAEPWFRDDLLNLRFPGLAPWLSPGLVNALQGVIDRGTLSGTPCPQAPSPAAPGLE